MTETDELATALDIRLRRHAVTPGRRVALCRRPVIPTERHWEPEAAAVLPPCPACVRASTGGSQASTGRSAHSADR